MIHLICMIYTINIYDTYVIYIYDIGAIVFFYIYIYVYIYHIHVMREIYIYT